MARKMQNGFSTGAGSVRPRSNVFRGAGELNVSSIRYSIAVRDDLNDLVVTFFRSLRDPSAWRLRPPFCVSLLTAGFISIRTFIRRMSGCMRCVGDNPGDNAYRPISKFIKTSSFWTSVPVQFAFTPTTLIKG